MRRISGGYLPSGPWVPEAEVWTEEMKLFALYISYATKLWFIYSFPYLFGPDPDPDMAKTCGSVRIRIRNPASKYALTS